MDITTIYNKWNEKVTDELLKKQLNEMKQDEIEDAFYKNLEFGTGGMRGEVGPGTNRLNIYTIRKATLGFAKYLLENIKGIEEKGIVIAFDCRHFSPEFAMESAKVMATNGIKCYVFSSLRPTPELSYAVRYLNAGGGVVITASHNPPQYNGYKIYDEHGCQLVPHLADQVIKYVDEIDDVFNIDVKEEQELKAKGLINIIDAEVDNAYNEKVKGIEINPDIDKSKIKIVFSPLHGTANLPVRRVLSECGYTNVHVVEEQTTPDPNFSTVKSPNPEDPESFDMAIELGEKINADILIATDPDADRVGLAVRDDEDKFILLNGNQTGAILLKYILSQRKAKNTLPKHGMVYNTIVTSQIGATIAKSYGLDVESTLTGFKFIGEKAYEIENTEKEFVFGYEESYGYLIGDFVRDKDSVQSVLMCAEAAAFYQQQGKTLYNVLNDIYEEYGYYHETLTNISLTGKEGQEKIKSILEYFRNNAPEEVNGIKISEIEDYHTSLRHSGNSKEKLTLPTSNVLKYFLTDGSWFVLRPSGTEPKMKIYIGVVDNSKVAAHDKNDLIKDFVLNKINEI